MKSKFVLLFFQTLLCLNMYSQVKNGNMVKSIGWMETAHFEVALDSKGAGKSLNTHLNIPNEYEFRNQIIRGTKDQTRATDEVGTVHERYDQYYKGIKIEHSDLRARYANGLLVSINGEYIDAPTIDISVALSKEAAIQKAKEHIGAKKYIWEDDKECEWLKSIMEDAPASCYPNPETVISRNYSAPDDTVFYLAYKVNIRALEPFSDDDVYVDAKTGKILYAVSRIRHVNGTAATRYSGSKTISTTKDGSVYKLLGNDSSRSIETKNMLKGAYFGSAVDFTDNDNNWTAGEFHNANKDDAALEAHWSAMVTWDYFKNIHGRNGFNGTGSTLKIFVHHGVNWSGAAWNTGNPYAYFGDGNGTSDDPYVALDIVAHEFGHGVNQYTANLHNAVGYESASIDEGISDIWGACVSNYANSQFPGLNKDVWLMGENTGFIKRSISNPGSVYPGYPSAYEDANWKINYDVHHNSTVMSHWFYLLSVGGSGTNTLNTSYSVSGIGMDKAAKILYKALSGGTGYMTTGETFDNARTHTIKAAESLYGLGSSEATSVKNAWHAVGIPRSITGSSYICSSATFTANNIVSGFSWGSSTNLTVPPGSGKNVTVTKSGNDGLGWLSLKNNNNVELTRLYVWVGGPTLNISGPTSVTMGAGNSYQAMVANDYSGPTITGYEWAVSPSNTASLYPYGNYASIYFNSSNSYQVTARACNTCGWGPWSFLYVGVNRSPSPVYPNPVSDILNIDFSSTANAQARTNLTYDVRLYDGLGNLLRQTQAQGGTTMQLNVSNLPNGIYYVHIYDGVSATPEMHQVIVKH